MNKIYSSAAADSRWGDLLIQPQRYCKNKWIWVLSPLNTDENQFVQVAKRVGAGVLLIFPTIAAYVIALPGIVLKAFQTIPPDEKQKKSLRNDLVDPTPPFQDIKPITLNTQSSEESSPTLPIPVVGDEVTKETSEKSRSASLLSSLDFKGESRSSPPSVSLKPDVEELKIRHVSALEFVEGKVKAGQGEYIVYHKRNDNKVEDVSYETYLSAYEILNENREYIDDSKEGKDRYHSIKEQLKKIDPTLRIIFIPKTLYELFFIHSCIQEDLENKKTCELGHHMYKQEITPEMEGYKKCWHICKFEQDKECDSNRASVKELAFRLNQIIFNTSHAGNMTLQEHLEKTEQFIQFLKEHHEISRDANSNKLDIEYNCGKPTLSCYFYTESRRGLLMPLGIKNEQQAEIIRNAVKLDCSKLAQKSLIVFRGPSLRSDLLLNKKTSHSLSYGHSLFAGCVRDPSATAFHYMRNENNTAYAIAIPFDQLSLSPFIIPPGNTMARLFGYGEVFHARTKVGREWDLKSKVIGIEHHIDEETSKKYRSSSFTQEELNTQFQAHKSKAILLNGTR